MSKQSLRVDIVSDVVCPWCIIGYKRLEKALEMLADEVEADIHWHPFVLNPHIGEDGQNLREHLAQKYGTTLEGSVEARKKLTQLGQDLGFAFDYFDEMKTYNTFKVHQLLHFAEEQGKQTELKLRLFSAFFGERKEMNDAEVLVAEAVSIGLDESECRAVLADERYAEQVQHEVHFWQSRGVQSVPTFVFNNRQAVAGAHEPSSLIDVMRTAYE